MNPGQRVNLIKKLAGRLAEQGFSDGDLILRQFGLPSTDSWSGGGPRDYFLQMLEQGGSEKLAEVHAFLFPNEPLPDIVLAPSRAKWPVGSLRLFISHSSTKRLHATQLKQELLPFGVESFVAHEDIEPSREWLAEIKLALGTCHAFVALICTEFKRSNFCDQEVGHALQRGLLVIPVRLELDPYGFMAPLQGISAFGKQPVEIAADIKRILEAHPTTKAVFSEAGQRVHEQLVNEFLCSSSYGTSTALLRKLEAYDQLPKRLVTKLATNWEKNDQISGCLGIPKRMAAFLRRHNMNELAAKIRGT